MLNYEQTMEKIQEIRNELKAIEAKRTCLKCSSPEFDEVVGKEQTLRRYLTIYRSNAEKLFIIENLQTAIDIINKYSGKRCGEKTKDKIITEAQERGLRIYFIHDEIIFYRGMGCNSTSVYTGCVNGVKQLITDTNNKINVLSTDMFSVPAVESIIDNVEEYTQNKEAEFTKIKEMYKALEDAVSAYNRDCPFHDQNIRSGIYYMD